MIDPAWLAIIIPVTLAAGTAASALLTSRRTSSGRIRSSEAEDLWEQTQKMMDILQKDKESLQRDKERAEDQRDKLIDLQRDQTQPILEAISTSQKHVLDILTRLASQMENLGQK